VTIRVLYSILAIVGVCVAQSAPVQPLPFSHKTHAAEAKLACLECHANPQRFGAEMGFPAASKCMACHVLVPRDKPAIRRLAELAQSKEPVAWQRVYRLAGFVFFDHRYHLMKSVKCEDCHGAVAEQDVTVDRLHSTSMTFCQACHTRTRAPNGCGVCHDPR